MCRCGRGASESTESFDSYLAKYGVSVHPSILCCDPAGLIPSDKESASYLLSERGGGQAIVIAVGGAPESLDAHPGSFDVLLAKKKGFIKMAMEHG